jgi:hypothetical protein
MPILLTSAAVALALDALDEGHGLESYLWIQSEVSRSVDFYRNETFRRHFNRFYRVRRAAPWRDAFYSLMGDALRERLEFPAVLHRLYEATSRYEAAFASKLVATLSPAKPIIDSIVLKNLGLRLPVSHSSDRAQRICQVYGQLAEDLSDFSRH